MLKLWNGPREKRYMEAVAKTVSIRDVAPPSPDLDVDVIGSHEPMWKATELWSHSGSISVNPVQTRLAS